MKNSRVLFSPFIFLSILLALTGCKTQEDIRREQAVESLNEKVQETQKSAAAGSSRFNSIEEQVSRLSGQVEEVNHTKAQSAKEIKSLNERLNGMEEANKQQVEYIKALTEKVNTQGEYLAEVVTTLEKLSKGSDTPKKKTVENNSSEESADLPPTFLNGMKKYNAKEYDEAKEIFQKVADNKKAKKKDREGSIHHLGMIEFKNKKYESAKVYFSKLFSDNPDSAFAPATLLNLAKTFIQLKSKEEAGMTLDELISRFPKSKEATDASKLKAKI